MSLNNLVNRWAQETPEAEALVFRKQTITFRELAQRASRIRGLLQTQFGVGSGDRVAWLGLNHPDMVATLLACEQCGAIFNPLNSRLAPQEYVYLLKDAEPRICLADRNFIDRIPAAEVPTVPILQTEILDRAEPATLNELAEISEQDPLLLVYTSGTTGHPKGVVLSRRAVMANIENCQQLYGFFPGQRVQVTLPLFHVGGLCILLLPALVHGATIHLHERFDPAAALNDIEANRIDTSIFVPAQMQAMMSHPNWESTDLSSLKYVVVGSSMIPLHQIRNFHARDIPVSQIYGSTETGPAAVGLAIEDARSREGSAGKALANCQIEVRNSTGASCDTGVRGNIWVRGRNLLTRYWRNEKETSKVLIDGWYNTGDIGYLDAEGFCWIVDRSRDVIISGGENIYPAEIEAVSQQHPAIGAICVVGRKDAHWGESPVAFVEPSDGQNLSLDEYHAFLTDKLARFKHPKSLEIVDRLPRNSLGKIQKQVLREQINGQNSSD